MLSFQPVLTLSIYGGPDDSLAASILRSPERTGEFGGTDIAVEVMETDASMNPSQEDKS